MTFKPAIWYPIAVALSVINLVAAGFALAPAEPWHASIHVGLTVAFGLWAQRLRQSLGRSFPQARIEALEALELDVSDLRRQLSETQERLDFVERVLARGPEAQRLDPERAAPRPPDLEDRIR